MQGADLFKRETLLVIWCQEGRRKRDSGSAEVLTSSKTVVARATRSEGSYQSWACVLPLLLSLLEGPEVAANNPYAVQVRISTYSGGNDPGWPRSHRCVVWASILALFQCKGDGRLTAVTVKWQRCLLGIGTEHEEAQRQCPTQAWWFGYYLDAKRLNRQDWAWIRMGECPDCQGMAHPASGLRGSLAEGHLAGSDEVVHGEASLFWKLHVTQLCAYCCLSSAPEPWSSWDGAPVPTRSQG